MKNSLVSAIVINWNDKKFLRDCLDSLKDQSYKNCEIIVVDNASQDGSVEFVEENYPGMVTVANKNNLGYSGAANIGIKVSSGEFILFMNPDVTLDKNFISELYTIMKDKQTSGVVGGKLLHKNSNIFDSTGIKIYKDRQAYDRGSSEEDKGQYDKIEGIFGICGAAAMYRRVALEDAKIVGEYFDEDMFAYKEDVDMCWRLRLLGWECFYVPHAIGYHDRGWKKNQRKTISKTTRSHSFNNRHIVMLKNELPQLFCQHFLYIAWFEIKSFLYSLLFEQFLFTSWINFLKSFQKIRNKRREIMSKKKVSAGRMAVWFR